MSNYADFPKAVTTQQDPAQLLPCDNSDPYKFERNRLGKAVTQSGDKYGPYLYRNLKSNVLMASWEAPTNKPIYTGYDIGTNADAMIYYKNN